MSNIFPVLKKSLIKWLLPKLYKKLPHVPNVLMDIFRFREAKKTIFSVFKGKQDFGCNLTSRAVFFFGSYSLSSFKLGGVYLIEALNRSGIKARSGRNRSCHKIKNSILVTVRKNHLGNLETLKKNNYSLPMHQSHKISSVG